MTTLEPGASVVFTHGFDLNPFSTAFFASRAAPIITEGLEVLVQEVIDAITTSPFFIVVLFSPTVTGYESLPVLSEK